MVGSSQSGIVEFRILGPLEVVQSGRAIRLGGARQRTLLALLLTRANEVVSVDRLIDALWGVNPPRAAANALQYHVSQLRKLLGEGETITTREPGYLIRVRPDELDLFRFERLVAEAEQAPPERAARLLSDALALWRGPPLADLADEEFAQSEIRRLEELRLAALERQIEAELALGRHAQLIPELEPLVREHPFRERLRAALMRALYAAGRQAEALTAYREARQTLVNELGIEPSPALQVLERAILHQDPQLALELDPRPPERAILVIADDEHRLDALLAIAEPLARKPARELILARLLASHGDLGGATAALAERRATLTRRGVACRVSAYTSIEPGADAALFASEQEVDLVLVDASREFVESGHLDERLGVMLERAPCDVALLTGSGTAPAEGPVVTPFGGVEHDWSAIELAAWLAASLGTTLRLLGTEADPALGRRDASRLLARASLLVQQVIGIVTEPRLIPAGQRGVVEAARDARLLVLGLSDRWRSEGIGATRLAVARSADVPILLVRRGLRPSGIAPPETLTRFTWTLGSQHVEPAP
jgi:DNA-binding SARP family transcriptional activator